MVEVHQGNAGKTRIDYGLERAGIGGDQLRKEFMRLLYVVHAARLPLQPRFGCTALVRLLLYLEEGKPVGFVGPDPDLGPVKFAGHMLVVKEKIGGVEIYRLVTELTLLVYLKRMQGRAERKSA